MKIASVTNTQLDSSLGSGKTVLAWSQGFKILGHEVDVISPTEFYRPWPGNKSQRLKMRLDAMGLVDTLLAGEYDLVEFYGAEFSLLIGRLARISRKDRPLLVAHTNGLELLAALSFELDVDLNESKFQRFLAKQVNSVFLSMDRIAFSKADAFVAICEADVNFVVQQAVQPSERCAVVEPGIDEIYLNAPWLRSKQPWLVSLGSWTQRKDPDSAVKVVTDLFNKIPDLQFHVLGASGAKENILDAFDETFKSRIIVHPRLPDSRMVEILSQAKVFLFPSLYEGFGMATTEAMACGCAVVVTPTGFGACIRDGVDGFVCNFRDTGAMTARCMQLFSDERVRTRLITAARARVDNLVWHHQVKRLETIYHQFISNF